MPKKKRKPVKKKTFHATTSASGSRNHFWRNFFLCVLAFLVVWFILSPYSDFNPSWQEPPQLVSANGKLDVSLTAQETQLVIDGKRGKVPVYNESYPGPVLDVKAGDTVTLHLTNNLDQPTNLHFQGGHISPRADSDNTLLTIQPGETFDYTYHIPANHASGLFWYHPVIPPYSDQQVAGGMAGAIIVRGDLDELPGIKNVPERLLVLTTQPGADKNNPVRLVNGEEMPALYIRPGELQRWRILNASADDYYNFSLPGQKLRLISRDGNPLDQVIEEDSEVLAPGDRIEILVKGGLWGTSDVDSLPFVQGFAHYEQNTFMHLVVAGFPVWPKEFPTQLISYDDLRDAKINNRRTFTFTINEDTDKPEFLINGAAFNPQTVSQVMILGTTEEWHLVNTSRAVIPIHIGVNPFQVISINGKAVDRHGYDDTFALPAHSTVVVRIPFKDFDGKFFLQSSALSYADQGMMELLEVIKPGYSLTSDNGAADHEKLEEVMQAAADAAKKE